MYLQRKFEETKKEQPIVFGIKELVLAFLGLLFGFFLRWQMVFFFHWSFEEVVLLFFVELFKICIERKYKIRQLPINGVVY